MLIPFPSAMGLQTPFSLITFLSLLFFFFFLIKLVKEVKRSKTPNGRRDQKLPPGPWKLPLIGHMHHLVGALPHHALRDLAKKHGPLIHLQLGEFSVIVISSPRLAKEVMKTHDVSFATRPKLLATSIITYNNTDVAFAPYGDYWRQMRKICTLELLSTNKVRSFSSIREDECRNLIESVRSSLGSPINLSEMITSMILAIICRVAFGQRRENQDTITELLKDMTAVSGGFDITDLFPSIKLLHILSSTMTKLLKLHKKRDQILDSILNEHTESRESIKKGNLDKVEEDLVDVLLRLKDNGGLNFPITSNNVKSVIWDVFGAGTDSSSATIEWAMAEIIRNPRVMEKAQTELRQALQGKKKIQETDIQELSYLKLVIKETLRLHPPFPLLLPRECREECEIDGYNIPIKMKVMINAWAIGRDPEYWKDGESFIPERFDDNNSINAMETEFKYLPFGAGRRMCPGVSLGLANTELPLAQLLYHFNWKLPNGLISGDLDMVESDGFTADRKNPLYLIPTPYITVDDSSN